MSVSPVSFSASQFRAFSVAERKRRLDLLSEPETAALLYDWEFWSRKNQRLPAGDWVTWLILAGRGYGKTRTGAETVRQWIQQGFRRVNIVVATKGDIEKVLVEGEGGVLKTCPPRERPRWIANKSLFRWPNGATSFAFSAEEPERLRGPESEKLWCDEIACFAAGTMIRTAAGEQPIEDIAEGTMVATRSGLWPVVHAWQSSPSAEIWELTASDGTVLRATKTHPFWTRRGGFIALSLLRHGDTLKVWDIRSSNGAESGGIYGRDTTKTAKVNCCTERNTSRKWARFSRRMTFIIETAIQSITTLATSLPYRAPSIFAPMVAAALQHGIRTKEQSQCDNSGRGKKLEPYSVQSVNARSTRLGQELSSAPQIAGRQTSGDVIRSRRKGGSTSRGLLSRVLLAEICSRLPILGRWLVRSHAASPTVRSVVRTGEHAPVYNISVFGCPEYYANGILVHNCWRYPETWDQARFGLRLGRNPQAVVTTTPKPTALVKALVKDVTTLVTRGTTYENRENLADAFFSHIITKYEGTRLGRQELNAELLEDNPGALWHLANIDQYRITKLPELRRIVVGVDPAVTSKPDSDATGIVVAGRDMQQPPHYYVFDDETLVATPLGWAKAVEQCYRKHSADRVVGEVNNGGDLIEMNLRQVCPNISYTAVHASRGKARRAEPIAALYEQGRVHHVGTLGPLEDEMCDFNPATFNPDHDPSPNRMDACVWALTELSESAGAFVDLYSNANKARAEEAEKKFEALKPKIKIMPREWSPAIRTIGMGIRATADQQELADWIAFCESDGSTERAEFAKSLQGGAA